MRYSTSTRYDRESQTQLPTVTAHYDCGHNLTYIGHPAHLDETVKANGGTATSFGSRCKECSDRSREQFAQEIRDLHRELRQ